MRALAALTVLLAVRLHAQERPRRLDDFLTRTVALDAGQMAELSRGEIIAKVLPTANERDVAIFGVVHVAVPRASFVEHQRAIPDALRTPTRTVVRVFSAPATAADVAALDVPSKDFDELRNCRPNDCNFKLPATDMDNLRSAIDWTAPNVAAQVSGYVRRRMVEYVTAYRDRGNAAMVVYDDLGSVHASEALADLLRDSSYVLEKIPSLGRHLEAYPHDSLEGASEVIFWSLDDLPHVRRVLRITHETIYSPPELPGTTVFAGKQIYADHYFEAGFELLTAVDDSTAGGDAARVGMTLVAVRRYRFDHLPRGGLLNIRGRVVGGLRDNVRADLVRLKRESESTLRAAAHEPATTLVRKTARAGAPSCPPTFIGSTMRS